jgi:HEAT repeat protein
MRTALFIPLLLLVAPSWARAEDPPTFYGKSLDAWANIVRGKNASEAERRQAIFVLGCFGPSAHAAVPDLVAAARGGPLQDVAVDSLVRIGAGAEVTVPYLIEQFVKEGCEHLTGMGSFGVLPGVKKSLVRIGVPAVLPLLRILNGPDPDMRVCAADVLSEMGPSARVAVPWLIRAIERPVGDDDAEGAVIQSSLIRYSVRALGRIGPDAKDAVPLLTRLMDEDEDRRFDVMWALNQIGSPPIKKLVDWFQREADTNLDPGFALACLGPNGHAAVPALREASADKRPRVRAWAAVALAHIQPSDLNSIPVLIESLKRPAKDEVDVSSVAEALGLFGPRAKEALPALIALADQLKSEEILMALIRIDPDGLQCVPALTRALKSSTADDVELAANCLSVLGSRATSAIPALEAVLPRRFENLSDPDHDPRVAAAKALRRIGGVLAVPALTRAVTLRVIPAGAQLGNQPVFDPIVAEAAARSLGLIGRDAKGAAGPLITLVRAKEDDGVNPQVRREAILALGRIGVAANAAIPLLKNLLAQKSALGFEPEIVATLVRLAPDGRKIGEEWLAKSIPGVRNPQSVRVSADGRALILGALGRSSLEADWVARRWVDGLHSMLASLGPLDGDASTVLEGWLQPIARLGPAGRVAIPLLNELRENANPLIRLWADETLREIEPPKPR